jgi:hypothetical protein
MTGVYGEHMIMKKISILILIVMIFSSCANNEDTVSTPTQTSPQAATFELVSYNGKDIEIGKASGVFLSPNGLAVTKYDALEGAAYAKAIYNGFVCDVEGFYYGLADCNVAIIKVFDKIEFPYLNVAEEPEENTDSSNFAIINSDGELIGIGGNIEPTYVDEFGKHIPNSVNLHPLSELRYDELVKPNQKYENYSYIPDFGAVMTKYATDKGSININTYAYCYRQSNYSEILKYCGILEENNLELHGEYAEGFVYTYGMFYVAVFNNNEKNRTEIVISSNDKWIKENFTEKKNSRVVPMLSAKRLSDEKCSGIGINRYEKLYWQSEEMSDYLAELDNAGFVLTAESPNVLAFESGYEEKSVCIYMRNGFTFVYVTDLKQEVQRLINLDLSNSHMTEQTEEVLPP